MVKSEQRAYIKFCVELNKTPLETKKLLEQTKSGSSVSRALVYRWHRRFSESTPTETSVKRAGRPTIIDDGLTSKVLDMLREDARLTVRDIANIQDIGIATAHKILCEHLNMSRVCVHVGYQDCCQKTTGSVEYRLPVILLGDGEPAGTHSWIVLLPRMKRGCISTTLKLNSNRVYGLWKDLHLLKRPEWASQRENVCV